MADGGGLSVRRTPFYRTGQSLDVPAGWEVWDAAGNLVRREWNPDRPRTLLEDAVYGTSFVDVTGARIDPARVGPFRESRSAAEGSLPSESVGGESVG